MRFWLPKRLYAECPCTHEPPRRSPWLTGDTTLPSVPSSGFLPLSTVLARSRLVHGLLDHADNRGARRFAALFHAARVSGASLQSFPFPGSRARSHGPFLPCGFELDHRQRSIGRSLTITFTDSRQPLALGGRPKTASRTRKPGRSFPVIARRLASTRSESVPHVPSPSHRHWARRLAAGTPTSKSCSPWESVQQHPLSLARPRLPVGALLGFVPSRACSTTVLGLVPRVDACRGPEPRLHAPPGAQPSRLHAATRTPTPEFANPGSVDVWSRSNSATSPAGSNPAC
jgi:hypothetical protein